MRTLRFSLAVTLDLSGPVTGHVFVLRLVPPQTPLQAVSDLAIGTEPHAQLSRCMDGFGNTLLTGRIDAAHARFAYHVSGIARTRTDRRDTQAPAPFLRHQTRLTAPGPAIREFLAAVPCSGTALEQACALMAGLQGRLRYAAATTNTRTRAEEALGQGCGVCQDFAHILLAALRSRAIACRYVSGLFLGEGASHAWVELWDGTQWIGLDPTHNRLVDDTYIKIAQGADFADCPLDSGVFCGAVSQAILVKASVTELPEDGRLNP